MRWLVVPLALVALVAWLAFRGEPDRGARAPGVIPTRAAGDGAAGRPAPDPPAPRASSRAPSPPPPVVATLSGRVFDPRGRPLHRAQVWVLRPGPLRLSITDADGRFELPLHRRGPHLVEAEWFTDLRAERRRVEVPETGDPPAIAFHLEAAGTVYGELTAGGAPVAWAEVDVYDGDEWILDTEADNGLFVFEEAPPVGTPLELRVRAVEGYPERPVRFTWTGEPMDLGTIELTRFPECPVRVVLPDGSEAEWWRAWKADGAGPLLGTEFPFAARLAWHLEHAERLVPLAREGGALRVAPPGPCRVDVWMLAGGADAETAHLVRRTLEFEAGKTGTTEVRVRPGPIRVRGRLLDDRGRPVWARFVLLADPAIGGRTDDRGRFDIEVPHGGVHRLVLSGLGLPETGSPLRVTSPRFGPLGGAWLDTDRPGEPCRYRATGRILVRCDTTGSVQLLHPGDRRIFVALHELEDGSFGAVSAPLDLPSVRWVLRGPYGRRVAAEGTLQLAAEGLTVLDLRR